MKYKLKFVDKPDGSHHTLYKNNRIIISKGEGVYDIHVIKYEDSLPITEVECNAVFDKFTSYRKRLIGKPIGEMLREFESAERTSKSAPKKKASLLHQKRKLEPVQILSGNRDSTKETSSHPDW